MGQERPSGDKKIALTRRFEQHVFKKSQKSS
jgi:hypothetical protein